MIINHINQTKLSKDIFINMLSLVFLAVGGLLTNFLIALHYNPKVLGVFNQIFAYYIVFSQIAVFGIHFSILKYTAQHSEDTEKIKEINTSAIVLILFISIFLIIVLNIFINHTNLIIDGFELVIPGLVFFALNKALLKSLNGQRKMTEYAIFNSLRYIFLLTYLYVLFLFNIPDDKIVLILTYSEFSLFIIIIGYFIKNKQLGSISVRWLKKHIKFGSKMVLGGLIVEFNTRIDVIVLGLITSDYIVGIYSFALVFAEGFYQIYLVIRKNINPLITKYYIEKDYTKFSELASRIKKKVYLFMIPLGLLIILMYPIICNIINRLDYLDAFSSLLILLSFMLVSSYYILFGNIASQSGYPFSETVINLITVGVNLIGNLILIPKYGLQGAAIATGMSYIINCLVIKIFSKHIIKFGI